MVLGALVLWLFLLSPFAQLAGQPSESQTFTVRGTVVNSSTGEPIRGALVQLYAGRPQSRLTGPQGEFVIENVPPGTFSVRVQKPGFFFANELPMSNGQPPMITVGPAQPPAMLKLVPEGLIYGRITGDKGEPVESLPVQLLFERVENGKKARSLSRGANTDEQGEFRLAELPPGKYFVFFGPSSFPSSFPARLSQPGARGYPAAFYPGVPDLASAAPIEITPGKRAEINLTLSSQPFYRISGTVTGHSQNQSVNLQILNSAGQPISGFESVLANGIFRTEWLPAGPCTLTAQMQDPATQQEYFASQNLNLTSDLTGFRLVLLPNISVPVNFHLETTRNGATAGSTVVFSSGPNGAQRRQAYIPGRVVLTPQNQSFSPRQYSSETTQGDDNSSVVRNLPPGVYSVEVWPNGPYYVQSARSGLLNLFQQPLTVAPGAALQPIEVDLRDDFATLEATVSFEPHDVSATLIAIPEDAPQQQVRNAGTAPVLGRTSAKFEFGFNLSQLRPGPYKLLAVDDPSFEYSNPDVLQKVLSKARDVFLPPGQQTKVSLELVRIGE